jgi:integrase
LVNVDDSWQRARKEAGVQDVRLHDLRRTVGSWLALAGNSLPLIGRVLNHTDPKTTAVYARLGDDPARQALADHAQRITAIAGEWFPAPMAALPAPSEEAATPAEGQ